MAFSGNNQSIYNALFDGAMGGMMAGRKIVDPTQADYNVFAAAATAFATKTDSLIPTDANLSTGAGGTTVPPTTAAITASLNAKPHLAFALAFGYFQNALTTDTNVADYTVAGTAVAAAYAAGVAAYANAPGGTSLS